MIRDQVFGCTFRGRCRRATAGARSNSTGDRSSPNWQNKSVALIGAALKLGMLVAFLAVTGFATNFYVDPVASGYNNGL